jgi:hypothetical protein
MKKKIKGNWFLTLSSLCKQQIRLLGGRKV